MSVPHQISHLAQHIFNKYRITWWVIDEQVGHRTDELVILNDRRTL